METLQEVIEDYKRKVKNTEAFLKGIYPITEGKTVGAEKVRLDCYRTFIIQLESVESNNKKNTEGPSW